MSEETLADVTAIDPSVQNEDGSPKTPHQVLAERNLAAMQSLQSMGGTLNHIQVVQLQIDVLTELLWPEGSATRQLYDLWVEQAMGGLIQAEHDKLGAPTLQVATHIPPDLA